MAFRKTEPLAWLDKLAALSAQLENTPTANPSELARLLNFDRKLVNNLLGLKELLDPVAIERIRQAAQDEHPYSLSYNNAAALVGLIDRVPDPPRAAREALEAALSRHLETRHIEALVEHLVEGKTAGEFDHTKVKYKKHVASEPEMAEPPKVVEEEQPKEKEPQPVKARGSHQRFLTGLWVALFIAIVFFAGWYDRNGWMEQLSNLLPSSGSVTANPGETEKAKPQEQALPTATPQVIPMTPVLTPLAIETNSPAPVSAVPKKVEPKPQARKTSSTHKTHHPTQPAPPAERANPYVFARAWLPSIEDAKTLDAEMKALSSPCLIKAEPIEPDPAISPVMAGNRLSDLSDPEKYTVRLGHEVLKIQSAVASSTGLTLSFQTGFSLGDLTSGFLGDPSKKGMGFYWEDVRAIHCNLIEPGSRSENPRSFYQCTILVSGKKPPLTVQCESAEDLSHFVSSIQFWIKQVKGAHAPLGSLLYLCQGVQLDSQGAVKTLWADSPTAQTGLKEGDLIWSVGTNPAFHPASSDLETSLQALTPGPHDLYVISPADWDNAKMAHNKRNPAPFNPIRRKVTLVVP